MTTPIRRRSPSGVAVLVSLVLVVGVAGDQRAQARENDDERCGDIPSLPPPTADWPRIRSEIRRDPFTEATVADPRLLSLAQKIHYVVNPANPYPRAYTGHLRARLKTGKVVEDRQPHLRGGAQEPLSLAEIERKFYANAAFGAWPREKAEAARALVARLFEGSVDLAPLRD